MTIQRFLKFYLGKQGHAQHGKEEQEEDQKCADIDHFWNRQNERLEDLLKILGSLDQLEDSCDSERAYDG